MPENLLLVTMRSAIEDEMKNVISIADGKGYDEYHHMLAYHLGWKGEGAGPFAQGKRIRPLLVLLTTGASGVDWLTALPAASAVEILHNFSLIHDDIEDNSSLRRGRPTVWDKWGIPQAINSGDAMLVLSFIAMSRMANLTNIEQAYHCSTILHETCLQLTQGQYLDMAFANQAVISLDDYWQMIKGKTAALLSACTKLGAIIADTNAESCKHFTNFGFFLGLAFQIQDDILGIWGDTALTGKSSESDLVEGKKSLPVVFGLNIEGPFAQRWQKGAINPDEVPTIAKLLEQTGALQFSQEKVTHFTSEAFQALELAKPQGEYGELLQDITNQLVKRQS